MRGWFYTTIDAFFYDYAMQARTEIEHGMGRATDITETDLIRKFHKFPFQNYCIQITCHDITRYVSPQHVVGVLSPLQTTSHCILLHKL